MIDERMEEQASLYVLGALNAEETRAFEATLARDPELRKLVASLSDVTGAVAGNIPHVEPPPALKQKILAQIDRAQKIVPMPTQIPAAPVASNFAWMPWALAACLAILSIVLAVQENNLRTQYRNLSAMTKGLQVETAGLRELVADLQSSTNNFQKAIAALQETNRLANMRIAMLGSLLADQPKAIAVSLWDEKNQNGVFVVEGLKPLPKDKDYQLWVIDPQYKIPVDAGVFKVDENGKVRFEFKPHQAIGIADKFAVTAEASGGSPTPKGTMVMVGG